MHLAYCVISHAGLQGGNSFLPLPPYVISLHPGTFHWDFISCIFFVVILAHITLNASHAHKLIFPQIQLYSSSTVPCDREYPRLTVPVGLNRNGLICISFSAVYFYFLSSSCKKCPVFIWNKLKNQCNSFFLFSGSCLWLPLNRLEYFVAPTWAEKYTKWMWIDESKIDPGFRKEPEMFSKAAFLKVCFAPGDSSTLKVFLSQTQEMCAYTCTWAA